MGKFINENGITSYVSDNGFVYSLLEGMTIGSGKRRSSDIMFVVLDSCDFNIDDNVACWTFGATFFHEDQANLAYIDGEVARFEERNGMNIDKYFIKLCGNGDYRITVRYNGRYAMVVRNNRFKIYYMDTQCFSLESVNVDCELYTQGTVDDNSRGLYLPEILEAYDNAKEILRKYKSNIKMQEMK